MTSDIDDSDCVSVFLGGKRAACVGMVTEQRFDGVGLVASGLSRDPALHFVFLFLHPTQAPRVLP